MAESQSIRLQGIEEILDEYEKAWKDGVFEENTVGPNEIWKIEYSRHLQENLLQQYDLVDISSEDIEDIVDVLDERIGISDYIPAYMIGGQSGGKAWRNFKEISIEEPKEAAETLSLLFNHKENIVERLNAFEDRYGKMTDESDVSGGPLLTLATSLLMFVYPKEYISYKYGMGDSRGMKDFFNEFGDYKVRTGFGSEEYKKLNGACLDIRDSLEGRIEEPSMIHVHNIVLYWEELDEQSEPSEWFEDEETDENGEEDTEQKTGESGGAVDISGERLQFDLSDESPPSGLYFEDWERIRSQMEATLNSGKNIIFTGPPGTGKTELAKWVSEIASNKKQVDDYKFTTATADWTAFDTVGGYTPSTDGDTQELEFEPRIFLKCFRENGEVVNRWLVIDEINRSDIDKAFGPLFSVLSEDSVELPYEFEDTENPVKLTWVDDSKELEEIRERGNEFPVTPSWRLIATMNTQDKASLYEMSYAFMRRFNFIHIGVPELGSEQEETEIIGDFVDADVWDLDVDEETLHSTERIWRTVNEESPIGPAIVKDMLEYVEAYPGSESGEDGRALSDAVVSLVFPQMEGMRPDEQKRLSREIADVSGSEGDRIKTKAEDFFGVEIETEDKG